jgi:hypothetical protein
MSATDVHAPQDRMRTMGTTRTEGAAATGAGGALLEAACGAAVIGLAIAGLAGAHPRILSGIAQIVFGSGLLCADSAVVACCSRLWPRRAMSTARIPFGGPLGAEAIAGLAGIILGILTLVDLVPLVLSAVAVIVFGAGVIMGGAARARAARRTVDRLGWTDEDDGMFQEAHAAALGSRAMVGFAAIVLGIIGVVLTASVPHGSIILSLVALLCLGAGGLLAGSAFGAQVWGASTR